jgi:predicted RNA-binding protein YlxR (DUF448 family)
LVRTADDGLQVDLTGKWNGRGAYLCARLNCWQRAWSSDILEKALRAPLTQADRDRLREASPRFTVAGAAAEEPGSDRK